jgi:hypothetical protein
MVIKNGFEVLGIAILMNCQLPLIADIGSIKPSIGFLFEIY